ncbi:nuclear transport factor 2 family protein [Arthrobacter sp. Z1-9]
MHLSGLAVVPTDEEVLAAASAIVEAFAATDTDRYFALFAEDATFVFHSEPTALGSRSDYAELWQGWLASGWRVVTCQSTNPLVTAFPGGAVFVHEVATTVETGEGQASYKERESIIFARIEDGSLVAVHEHLSPFPAAAP